MQEAMVSAGFGRMRKSITHILRVPISQKSRRLRSRLLSGLLAASILILPARHALADGQVLELPRVESAAAAYETPAPLPRVAPPRAEDDRPVAGMGSLQDYERDDGQAASQSPSLGGGYASSGVAPRPERPTNQDALLTDVIVGAVAIGLFALEVHAAQHHHR